jgi:putative tryptophan/tyrosine transport system substrate-binding protein
MDRRAFLATLSGGLVAVPGAAGAQPAEKRARVGLLSMGTDPARPGRWQPFVEAMGGLGFVEGRNLEIKRAFAGGRAGELPRLVEELLRTGVDVLVVSGPRETAAARRATSSVPIVMMVVADPVGEGFVASLARPGGTVTGLTNTVPGLLQKYVELLHEAVPAASRFAVVANPPNPLPGDRRQLEAASKSLGITLSMIPVSGPEDFDGGLARARRDRVGAILATTDPVTLLHRKRLIAAASKHQLPGIFWDRLFVEDGGLMSYSVSFPDLLRQAAVYASKILKGARPADLPVEQPTRLELVVNQRAAQALGLTLPPSLLARADQVIS